MIKLVTHVGDNGIYTETGDKVGLIFDGSLADDVIDRLNLDEEEMKSDDDKTLLESLKHHKIETGEEIDYYVKAKELQEKNEPELDNIYELLTNILVWDGLSDSQLDDINDAIETMKKLEKLSDELTDKEKKQLAEKREIKMAEKEADRIITNAKKYAQKILAALEKNTNEVKKLLEEKP